ncbi:MAG: GNAT family N-acetyltransferase [Weeksellaceae bacterium]
MNLKIREIQPQDNVSAATMIRSVFDEFNAPKEGTVYTDASTDALFELFEKENKSKFWVIAEDHHIYGSCGIYPTQDLSQGTVELVKFYISAQARGQGYGKKLLDIAIQEAKNLGYKSIYLETITLFGKAMDMYTQRGFKFLEEPLGNSGHFACEIKMLKEF